MLGAYPQDGHMAYFGHDSPTYYICILALVSNHSSRARLECLAIVESQLVSIAISKFVQYNDLTKPLTSINLMLRASRVISRIDEGYKRVSLLFLGVSCERQQFHLFEEGVWCNSFVYFF